MNSNDQLTTLRAAVTAAATPAARAHALNNLAKELGQQGSHAEALTIAEEACELARETGELAAEAEALRLQGVAHLPKGDYSRAMQHFEESLKMFEGVENRSGVARATGNIGVVHYHLSEYEKALEYFTRALALHEELGDRSNIATVNGRMGVVYRGLSDYGRALDHLTRALAIHQELDEHTGVAYANSNIGIIYGNLSDFSQAMEHFGQALALYQELGDRSGAANVTVNIGNVYVSLSDYNRALEQYTRGRALFEELGARTGFANVTGNIGGVYYSLGDLNLALEYYTHARTLHEELGSRSSVARATGNIGNVLLGLLDYHQALEYHTRALNLYEELGVRSGVAEATGSIGIAFLKLAEYDQAMEYFTHAHALFEELGDRSNAAIVTANIGALYAEQRFSGHNRTKAEELLLNAIMMNEELGAKQELYEDHQTLAGLYQQESRFEDALHHFRKYHDLYEEVHSEEAKKRALQVEQQRQIAEMEKRTAAERADAEATKRVLHNILPPTIANRVVRGEERIAESFDSVTVLFADIVGFTLLSQHITATELVTGLDLLFSQFDELAEKYGLEKIKTIGDAYMAVSGLPVQREDHAESAAKMAMEMVEVVSEFQGLGESANLQVRIGLHTGEVVAGIIGKKKFAYDLWGDAVNTASRMESHGEAGKIHVSEEFAQALLTASTPLKLHERGILSIKGKGELRTYFLTQQ